VHLVTAAGRQDRSKLPSDGKHDVFLSQIGAGNCAWVRTTMAGIDYDHGTRVAPLWRLLDRSGPSLLSIVFLLLERPGLPDGGELGGIDAYKVEHEVRGLVLLGWHEGRILDQHWSCRIDNKS
jgi:hypothetical protein